MLEDRIQILIKIEIPGHELLMKTLWLGGYIPTTAKGVEPVWAHHIVDSITQGLYGTLVQGPPEKQIGWCD